MSDAGTDDYLPGRRVRTRSEVMLRFVALIAMFVALVFAIRSRVANDDARRLLAMAAFVVPVIYISAVRDRARRFSRALALAAQKLHQGQPARAEQDLAALAGKYRRPRVFGRVVGYNHALALMRTGRLADATAKLIEVDRGGGVIRVDGAIASTLAYLHALRGNRPELAETWVAEAKRRDTGFAVTPFAYTLPLLAIAIRKGDASKLLGELADRWTEAESMLKGERLKPLRVLRAFGVAQTTDVRDAGQVAAILAPLAGTKAAELAYLGAEWPALEQFIRANLAA